MPFFHVLVKVVTIQEAAPALATGQPSHIHTCMRSHMLFKTLLMPVGLLTNVAYEVPLARMRNQMLSQRRFAAEAFIANFATSFPRVKLIRVYRQGSSRLERRLAHFAVETERYAVHHLQMLQLPEVFNETLWAVRAT